MARIRGRVPYATLVGFAAGALVTGLVLPFAIDDEDAPAAVGARGAPVREATHVEDITETTTASSGEPLPADAPAAPSAPSARTGAAANVSTGAATSEPLRASDVGVTASTIKLGVVLLDLTTVGALGLSPANYDLETQRKSYEAAIKAINAAGGIHGRTIQPAYAKFDPLQGDTALAACSQLTEDERVFIVTPFAAFTTTAMRCVAQQHVTPIVVSNSNPPTSLVDAAQGRLVSDGMSTRRLGFNFVNELHQLGLLKDKKIGIVADDGQFGSREATEGAVAPALRQLGYGIARQTFLSGDLQTAAAQIPVEVQQMRSGGVDAVLFLTTSQYADQWVQSADRQGWRPQYLASDLSGLTCDTCMEAMPEGYHGAIAITERHFVRGARDGMPEPAVDRACRETYNRTYNEGWKYGDRHPFYNVCAAMEIIRRTLTAAGVNPTRASWAANARSIGDFPIPTVLMGGLTGKTDYPNTVVTIRYDVRCTDHPATSDEENGCYRTVDQPRRARY